MKETTYYDGFANIEHIIPAERQRLIEFKYEFSSKANDRLNKTQIRAILSNIIKELDV